MSSLILSSFDPTDPAVFQTVFGMILTLIIALEFKQFDLDNGQTSAERCTGRTVVLIAMLAVIRKFIAGCSHYCLRRRLLAGSRTRPQGPDRRSGKGHARNPRRRMIHA
ncbi:phosphate-starvation-inducible PsiE family protein [Propylenella binzhouense]|uniref:phosphate-starvation-inducible PsiE family protein n=1 Tax=Propylenella binzhouense TaxID=2555902 RepID=UPI001FE248BD|nr:phosphate-starvation-inducible PsiE family protein [Propylenella binzhouense]